jgi:hypothetical protein
VGVVQKRRHPNAFRIFENGKQAGEWTTYDDKGKVVKVTTMKSPVDQSLPSLPSE